MSISDLDFKQSMTVLQQKVLCFVNDEEDSFHIWVEFCEKYTVVVIGNYRSLNLRKNRASCRYESWL